MTGRFGSGPVLGSPPAPRRGLPFEVVAVGLLVAVVSLEVLLAYAWLDPDELYHVSGSGLAGGASRVLVLLNFPIALVAIAVLALLAERLGGRLAVLGVAGIVLCATVAWPGVVDQADLDAKPVNALAALGVAVALALGVVAWRAGGIARPARRLGDGARVAVAAVTLLLSVPWLLAEVGLSLDGVTLLGSLYQTGELRTQPGDPVPHPAVHLGHHHGGDGMLLVLTALLLSRVVPAVRAAWVRGAVGGYVALMLCYGAANLANDFWLEQIVKRGWANRQIPGVTEPKLSLAWAVIVLAAAGLWTVAARRSSAERAEPPALPAASAPR